MLKSKAMVTPEQCTKKYGDPSAKSVNLVVWLPEDIIQLPHLPKRIFCNRDLIKPLRQALVNLIARGHKDELHSWDGCFNIREQRGSTQTSLHSWAIAIDLNAAENPLGKPPVLSDGFVKCFTDAGFDWGGNWKRKDGMHFQLSKI